MLALTDALTKLDLPRRWTDLAARLPGSVGEEVRSLYEIERLTAELGLPFAAKEFDDEDYWPASRAEIYPDGVLRMRIDRRGGGHLRFEFEVDRVGRWPVERLVERLSPSLTPVAPLGELSFRKDAVAWFVALCRDIARLSAAHFRAGLQRPPSAPPLTADGRYQSTVVAKSGAGLFVDIDTAPAFVPVEELAWDPAPIRVGSCLWVVVLDPGPPVATASARFD